MSLLSFFTANATAAEKESWRKVLQGKVITYLVDENSLVFQENQWTVFYKIINRKDSAIVKGQINCKKSADVVSVRKIKSSVNGSEYFTPDDLSWHNLQRDQIFFNVCLGALPACDSKKEVPLCRDPKKFVVNNDN